MIFPFRYRSGFTLVELLITLVVLGILFVLGLFLFGNVQDSSHNTAAKADVRGALMKATSGYVQNQRSFGSTTAEAINRLEALDTDGLSYTSSTGTLSARQVFVQLDDASTGYTGPVGQQITLCVHSQARTARVYCLRTNQEQAFPVSSNHDEESSLLINTTTNVAYANGPNTPETTCALPQPGSSLPDPWPPSSCDGLPGWGGSGSGNGGGSEPVSTGDVYSWGWNSTYARLGLGYVAPGTEPIPVEIPDFSLSYVGGGESHGCGLADNNAFCWGRGTLGAVGDGNMSDTLSPVPIETENHLAGRTITKLSSGHHHSCVIADGDAFCWGWNDSGRLGTGDTTTRGEPWPVDTSGVLSGRTVTDIAAGNSFTCAVADGDIFCWGEGGQGQMGNGGTASSSVPVAATMTGDLSGRTITQIDANDAHACVIADGEAFCWGRGNLGQIGGGVSSDSYEPLAVNTSGVLSGRVVSDLGVGALHTCAIADGEVFCWGYNADGQLGDATNNSANVPVAVNTAGVLSGTTATQIDSGSGHSCVVASGDPFCWGSNWSNLLGDGSGSLSSNIPVAVDMSNTPGGDVLMVASMPSHNHLILSD